MKMFRDFFSELKEFFFKPITYTIYNKMDDDGTIDELEKKYKEPLSINDFKYFDFDLDEKEKFLIKMYNKEYKNNILLLKEKLKRNNLDIVVYVDHIIGNIRLVKINKIKL